MKKWASYLILTNLIYFIIGINLQVEAHISVTDISVQSNSGTLRAWKLSALQPVIIHSNQTITEVKFTSGLQLNKALIPVTGKISTDWSSKIAIAVLSLNSNFTTKYKLTGTLITSWRANRRQENLLFHYVQFPVYKLFQPEFRNEQTSVLNIHNTGMAGTLDVADANLSGVYTQNNKYEGIRLAKITAAKICNQKVVFRGPFLQLFTVEGNKLYIKFQAISIGSRLVSKDSQPLTQFEIAGASNKYVVAQQVIEGNDIIGSTTSIAIPTNVAFAYSPTTIPNLTNKEGLQVYPFRKDKWNYSIKLT